MPMPAGPAFLNDVERGERSQGKDTGGREARQ